MNTKVAEAVGTTIEELQDVIEYDDTQKQEVKYEVKENNDIKYLVADNDSAEGERMGGFGSTSK